MAVLVAAAMMLAGCGSSRPEAAPYDFAEGERETTAVYVFTMLHSLCRDADLGKHKKITKGIRDETGEMIRNAKLHPDDKLEIMKDGSSISPAEALHMASDSASCQSALSKKLEIAARDSEDLQK